MVLLHTIESLKEYLAVHNGSRGIGLVPTMGALHEGHLSLIRRSREKNDLTVCSVFVNPIQFNNKEDLKNYPRNIENDASLLRSVNCDVLFAPTKEEMYPEQPTEKYDFGDLENLMEDKYRPGHFNGVATIVNRLFEIVQPKRAYFGNKDFQQVAVVKQLVRKTSSPVEIISCPTIREKNGLAISSRNQLLSEEEKENAAQIYQWLKEIEALKGNVSVDEIKRTFELKINQSAGFQLEYLEISDAETLQVVNQWSDTQKYVCCIAVYLGKVRLIDNLLF